jgi:nitrogen regulatory protein PII
MRLVVAVLKPAQVEAVRQALAAVHVTRLTICDAQGYSGGSEGNTALVQESVMEIAVNEDFLERTVETIHRAIHKAMHLGETAGGDAGDTVQSTIGSLFVLPIDEALQLYREVRGPEAV